MSDPQWVFTRREWMLIEQAYGNLHIEHDDLEIEQVASVLRVRNWESFSDPAVEVQRRAERLEWVAEFS